MNESELDAKVAALIERARQIRVEADSLLEQIRRDWDGIPDARWKLTALADGLDTAIKAAEKVD